MKAGFHSSVILVLGLLLAAAPPSASPPSQEREPVEDFTSVDPASLGVEPVPAEEDPRTGFVVGGRNPTALIRTLTQINGRTIAELEEDMRPGAFSEKGFLGEDEGLLDVMATDNETVVDELGLTHQELARHLLILAAVGSKVGEEEFLYHGRRFRVKNLYYRGLQPSPFRDGTETNAEAIVRNLDNGEEIRYSLLVPRMVERYGFYEGEGTPYRVDPRKALEVLDFLKGEGR
jgi:hypothetical protein